ncbi:MAG: acetyl/propionyl/methylcrotonyl-CoA carboxylase subunit alpha [Rhizobiales bacterium]|nr:acetyl/propionyl/methylcrotonyl-CoA carboxylase subunit alpha [Hyphomicrobiales bacterium]
MLSSVLIANRGEIACRIARTARRLGMRVIAVYSDADRDALHVSLADEAHRLGPAEASQSYLNAARIIEIAKDAKAAAIHPGYGFLSENTDFAEAVEKAGIVFVGPPPAAIRAMGLKDAAKRLMAKAGVPVVPGYDGEEQDSEFLSAHAAEIGYPVMIKAVAGGGGKGMRHVAHATDFASALDACRREAASAFGNEHVLIEKFIARPRHIEIQIMADSHGNCVSLFERDCSLQRRHQKVIEESPAPGMTRSLRQRMGEAATAGAKAVGYCGAGTMEFIVGGGADLESAQFYFMEMNTRLQVEHPVTEMVTGLDLVELQFRVASGEALPFRQDDLKLHGHAIEARLYAEDPDAGFLPQAGTLLALGWPGDGIRIDTGVRQGDSVTPYYDPMIAKLIAHGETREEAIRQMAGALSETRVLGLKSNKALLAAILAHPAFRNGDVSTGFIDHHIARLVHAGASEAVQGRALAAWLAAQYRDRPRDTVWTALGGWSLGGTPRKDFFEVLLDGLQTRLVVESGHFTFGKHRFAVDASEPLAMACDGATGASYIEVDGVQVKIEPADPLARDVGAASGSAVTRAPMAGKIVRVLVAQGGTVRAGAPLLILEAMKMEHPLKAGISGTIKTLSAVAGAQVAERDVLCVIEPPAAG